MKLRVIWNSRTFSSNLKYIPPHFQGTLEMYCNSDTKPWRFEARVPLNYGNQQINS